MKEEPVIRLDFTDCSSALEFHHRIKTAFRFPDWYGCNWNAFYDLLSTDVEENRIIITGVSSLPKDLHEYIPDLLDVLEKIKKEQLLYGDIFSYEIVS